VQGSSFHLLGIAGSLRQGSYNRGLLRAAAEVLPPGVTFAIHPIDEIPHFNQDVLALGDPPAVRSLKEGIASADALLIATPENNYSIPGVLKNAIDWASRPNKTSVLKGKPIGIIGASTGEGGTVRAQLALRQVFVLTNSLVMIQPELRVPYAAQKFDEDGNLVDGEIRARLASFITSLVEWARLVTPPKT
jgi:chromate reductase, NAD(P)H dehydrogenase (quinone)